MKTCVSLLQLLPFVLINNLSLLRAHMPTIVTECKSTTVDVFLSIEVKYRIAVQLAINICKLSIMLFVIVSIYFSYFL